MNPATYRLVDRSSRVRLDLTGPDRAKFLHNLTTQEVKRLPVGRGGEAFVTSPQGKTLGYVTLLALDDRILLRSDREGWGPVLPHLTKYGVFDDVALDDVSEATFEIHLAGPGLESRLADTGLAFGSGEPLSIARMTVENVPVTVVRESLIGPDGLTFIGPREGQAVVVRWLEGRLAGPAISVVSPDEFEAARIAAGLPIAGRDVTPDNLPQEVARDRQAISFVKGCYLGQETVARIDALGHVNKLLRGLRVGPVAGNTDAPGLAGARLEADGKAVGQLTSAAVDPSTGSTIALGYVRTSHAKAGSELTIIVAQPDGTEARLAATVADLPMDA